MEAYSDMLTHTSTDEAPWHVIPADNKWFMRYIIGQIISDRIEELDLHYPELTDEAKIEIENAKKSMSKPQEEKPKIKKEKKDKKK